jgi:hypothetical protein
MVPDIDVDACMLLIQLLSIKTEWAQFRRLLQLFLPLEATLGQLVNVRIVIAAGSPNCVSLCGTGRILSDLRTHRDGHLTEPRAVNEWHVFHFFCCISVNRSIFVSHEVQGR